MLNQKFVYRFVDLMKSFKIKNCMPVRSYMTSTNKINTLSSNLPETITQSECNDSTFVELNTNKTFEALLTTSSISPSPSDSATTMTFIESLKPLHNCSVINLTSNEEKSSTTNKSIINSKPRPPPITGLPLSPTHLHHHLADSLQTPIVTIVSPFKLQTMATPDSLNVYLNGQFII
ncbi:unnamed protein product [Medioppia subpectinata]|uniref:Uncharacterized protein n=1 Tax=Medioppia subpectinata TaxID=1979941 RepID=A0A7R9KL90_9ACAR|nr:unnamed protein product [Medioppia subpectinata]CAG2105702.1 unnamed protein product [Medioppia subpectinata]